MAEVHERKSKYMSLSHVDIIINYHKISKISSSYTQNFSDSGLVLQLPLPIPFKPGLMSRMKM